MGLEKINDYKKIRNLTNKDISDITGISISSLDKITSGSNTNPKLETVKSICSALDCKLSDLLDDDIQNSEITPQEQEYIKKYRTLDTYGQKAVSAVLNIEYERCTTAENTTVHTARIAAYGGGTKKVPALDISLNDKIDEIERQRLIEEIKANQKSKEK